MTLLDFQLHQPLKKWLVPRRGLGTSQANGNKNKELEEPCRQRLYHRLVPLSTVAVPRDEPTNVHLQGLRSARDLTSVHPFVRALPRGSKRVLPFPITRAALPGRSNKRSITWTSPEPLLTSSLEWGAQLSFSDVCDTAIHHPPLA